MDKKLEKFLISVGGSEDASDTETDDSDSEEPMKLNEQIKI